MKVIFRELAVIAVVLVLSASLASCGDSAGGDPTQNLSQEVPTAPAGTSHATARASSSHGPSSRKGKPEPSGHRRKGQPDKITLTEIGEADQFMSYVKRACGSIYGASGCVRVTYTPRESVGLADCQISWTSNKSVDNTGPGADVQVPRSSRIAAVLECASPVTDSPNSTPDSTDGGSTEPGATSPTDQTEPSPTS